MTVKEACADPLAQAKIAFFYSEAKISFFCSEASAIKPFLWRFQPAAPISLF